MESLNMAPYNNSVVHTSGGWKDEHQTCAHGYILPSVIRQIKVLSSEVQRPLRILDIGCGNGYVASKIAELGHSVWGVDVSPDGIDIARSAYPTVQFKICSIYDESLANVVPELVDCDVSIEVLEHLFYPRKLFQQSHRILRPGGYLLLSTPYHGYLKNLAISLADGWDKHFAADCDGGHIKLFSKKSCERMASQVGFRNVKFEGVGRLPWFWKSMVMIAEKQAQSFVR